MARSTKEILPRDRIDRAIYLIRGDKVILDQDLAVLYEVETKALVQSVKRNRSRFPTDFMFQLSDAEFEELKSRIVTSNRSGRRTRPYAFTKHGVAMLSGVLRSRRAILVNIEIMRAFVRLRRLLLSQEALAHKLESLERRYDHQFKVVFDAIRKIMDPGVPPKRRRIGFRPDGS